MRAVSEILRPVGTGHGSGRNEAAHANPETAAPQLLSAVS